MNNPILELRNVVRNFQQGDNALCVLREVNLQLYPGEIVALIGPSGAGKSTLLHTAGLLESAESGKILIQGKDCAQLTDYERTRIRLNMLGFIYQFHHLLPEFTAEENVSLPQMICGVPQNLANIQAKKLLSQVGLSDRTSHRPARLSGGEQQRVAIARALANQPKILLADEPTGNLDEGTSEMVFDVLIHLVRQNNVAALIATHNPSLAKRMDRIINLQEGKLTDIEKLGYA